MQAGEASPLAAILGTSRSGSTWLGSIVASHPEVVYRFEPLHRLSTDLRRRVQRVLAGDCEAGIWEALHAELLPADARVDKPPFFHKSYRTRASLGMSLVWPVARMGGAMGAVYRYLYSPVGHPLVVFKEVNYERLIGPLLAAGSRVLYIVRHPCGVVWSHLKGQEQGQMSGGRELQLDERLAEARPVAPGLERFAGRTDALTKAQKRALLWRLSVDVALSQMKSAGFQTVVYERLARDPGRECPAIFQHLGLSMEDATVRFLEDSTSGQPLGWLERSMRYGDFSTRAYFSVFKDPNRAMSSWRQEMPEAMQREVLEVVSDSTGYRVGLESGAWA